MRLPAIVGTYERSSGWSRRTRPPSARFDGRVEGRVGTITGRATFRLAESEGGTTIEYEGTGVVGGPLARLDSRFVEGIAEVLIDEDWQLGGGCGRRGAGG